MLSKELSIAESSDFILSVAVESSKLNAVLAGGSTTTGELLVLLHEYIIRISADNDNIFFIKDGLTMKLLFSNCNFLIASLISVLHP